MSRRSIVAVSAIAIVALAMGTAGSVSLGTKVLKGAAIGYAVKQSGGALDKFINTVTLQRGLKSNLDTKVVPIISVGDKGYVGGAQVAGPKSLVDKVQAVFQYEANYDRGQYRIKALVPSSSLNPLQLKRVEKVGVSAIIDVAVDGGLKHQYVGGGVGSKEVVRAAAVAVGIKALADPLNSLINKVTFNKGTATAVVPMASFGEKAYIGGAQITGSANVFDDVAAVWQYEDLFSNGKFRVKILVPTNSSNPLKMKRVQGAGITAVIDTTIANQGEVKKRSAGDSRRYDSKYGKWDKKDDNGKHKGWYNGKHKGWDKKNKDKRR